LAKKAKKVCKMISWGWILGVQGCEGWGERILHLCPQMT